MATMAGWEVSGTRSPDSGAGEPAPRDATAESTEDRETGARRRRIVPRRRLPSGRAVVGGLLVTLSALGILVAYIQVTRPPRHRFLVARRTLDPGTILAPSDLGWARIDLPEPVASRAVDDPDAVIGRRIRSPLSTGELVQLGSVSPRAADGDTVEVPVRLDGDRGVAPHLEPGQLVDVLSTGDESGSTDFVVRGAVVARVEGDSSALGSLAGTDVSLLVAPADVEALVDASRTSRITIVEAAHGQ